MPLDHYLPATHLASFSMDYKKQPRRKRSLVVGDLVEGRCFQSNAGNVCAINDFYPSMLDDIWKGYEARLAPAILSLLNRSIDAKTLARVLVPFVAGLLVRGPDFNQRFELRLNQISMPNAETNTNGARMMELQRLLAPIASAKWIVLTVSGRGSTIINDIGFLPSLSTRTRESGVSIPLDLRHVLVLVPQRKRKLAELREEKWVPIIEYEVLEYNNHLALNSALAASAQRFIFGPNKEIISRYMPEKKTVNRVPEPEELGFISGKLAVVHEFAWHRFVGMLEESPFAQSSWNFDLVWGAIASDWTPAIIFPTNLPEFPSPLARVQNSIYIDLYDLPGSTE
jgi:hypothetical protein